MFNDDIEYTHDPLFGTPIDQGVRFDPGPVESSTTHPSADWTYRPHPWHPHRPYIGDMPVHPTTYPYPYPVIPAPPTTIITTTANTPAPSAEKPHHVIDRACHDLAIAARELRESAEALGLDLSEKDIRTAIYKRVAKAIGD